MSRNLFGISAKGVVLRAASGLYAIIFCQAIVQDAIWLWILSIAGGLIIIALLGAPNQEPTLRVKRPPHGPFIDPIDVLVMPAPGQRQLNDARRKAPFHLPPQGDGPHAGTAKPKADRSFPERQYLRKERRQALQLVLLDSPPICLN